MKFRHFFDRADHRAHFRDRLHDPADAPPERFLQPPLRPAVVHRAERLGPPRGAAGDQGDRIRLDCPVEEALQEGNRHCGHVARHDEIPIGGGIAERREDTAKRSFPGVTVRNCAKAAQLGATHDRDAAGGGLDSGGYSLSQRSAAERKERFVATHPAAPAARQDVPRATHTEMIPLEFSHVAASDSAGLTNILMRLCFIIALGGLAATSAAGADAPEQPRRITSVVRSDPRTGKLVRSMVVTAKSVGEKSVTSKVVASRVITPAAPAVAPAADRAPVSKGIDETVEAIAAKQAVPPELIHSVIKVESNYNPNAVSSKGALGLMQLIPSTARRFGVSDVFNPQENIEGGARYLRYLLDLYNWDLKLALAAYNAGEGAVAKYGGVPPYTETRNYIVSVGKQLEKSVAAKPRQTPQVPAKAEPRNPDAPNPIREIVETDGSVRYVSR